MLEEILINLTQRGHKATSTKRSANDGDIVTRLFKSCLLVPFITVGVSETRGFNLKA